MRESDTYLVKATQKVCGVRLTAGLRRPSPNFPFSSRRPWRVQSTARASCCVFRPFISAPIPGSLRRLAKSRYVFRIFRDSLAAVVFNQDLRTVSAGLIVFRYISLESVECLRNLRYQISRQFTEFGNAHHPRVTTYYSSFYRNKYFSGFCTRLFRFFISDASTWTLRDKQF